MKPSETWLERVRQWDEGALAQVYDEYAPAIYRYAYRRTGHRETAQEIVAETFQRFLAALKNGGGPERHLSGWLYRVAHNLIVDSYRRQPTEEPKPLDETLGIATDSSHEAVIFHHEQIARARAAMRLLTPLQQEVIALRFLEEMSYQQVAQIIERDVGAVKSLQHRALEALRRILEEDNGKGT